MKNMLALLVAFSGIAAAASGQDALTIVRKLDSNEVYSTLTAKAEFVIRYSGKRIVKSFVIYAKGDKNSFVEFTNREDAGTKLLKKDGKLFLYSPDAEAIIPITGHMLKDSMMGSDLSYEDTVGNDTLESLYNARIAGDASFKERPCWILDLEGKTKTISYPKVRMWVDKESLISLLTERYALSGAILKEERVLETQLIANRRFPVKVEVRDLLRNGSSTLFTFSDVELDRPIPDRLFSMRNLER